MAFAITRPTSVSVRKGQGNDDNGLNVEGGCGGERVFT